MIGKALLVLATAALALTAAAPVRAKTRAETVNPHCAPDGAVAAPGRRLKCGFEGFGKFEINAEASLKKGAANARAQLAIAVDGRACGRSDPVTFSGRQTIYQACSVQETGFDRHDFTVTLDLRDADYGSMDVNVVRRIKGARKPGQ